MSDVEVEPLRAWALVERKKPRGGYNARIRGGDSRCNIFWTRQTANRMQQLFPDCVIVPVVVRPETPKEP